MPALVAMASAAAATAVLLKKEKRGRTKSKEKKDFEKPAFEDKSIKLVDCKEELVAFLKNRHYLEVSECEYSELTETIEKETPDLLLINCDGNKEINAVLSIEKPKGMKMSVLTADDVYQVNKAILEASKKMNNIAGYASEDFSESRILINAILPALNPNWKSDESLENIGKITDLLGLPRVSDILNALIAGREIKEIIEQDEKVYSDAAVVLEDMASIFGLEKLETVASAINNLVDVKTAVSEESGAKETKDGIEAAKDLKDIVDDVIEDASKYFVL